MENKNFLVAMVLMLAVWVGFSFFFPNQPPNSPSVSTDNTQTSSNVDAAVTENNKVSESETVQSDEPIVPVVSQSTDAKEIHVENDVFKAVFSTMGGDLKSLVLKKYKITADENSPFVTLVDQAKNPFGTLLTKGRDGLQLNNTLNYSVSSTQGNINITGNQEQKLVLTGVTQTGLVIQKTYIFYGDKYNFGLNIKLQNQGTSTINGGLDFEMIYPWEEHMEANRLDFFGPATFVGDKLKTEKVKDLKEKGVVYGSDTAWSGFETKYFLTAGMPNNFKVDKVQVEFIKNSVFNIFETSPIQLNSGEQKTFDFTLYYGPRDLDVLKSVNEKLSRAIDFGFFSLLARPLLHVLKFFYTFLGNYGLAIILLTIIIKGIFWPLTQKSYSSMKAMQVLQPQMQKIREKYKNDRERLNREIMELYKTHRVNPLGGCLPMLIQIPVFFALYKVLLNSIELRHAPFYFWLTDLSAKDPYYITPVIMGITMFIQQKMTPSTMDPTQAKVFMLMPILFTFIFLNFPSGLVIYWLVNNVLTIFQQYLIHKPKLTKA